MYLPYLLQLASPALPVGAYSYSEGIETLVVKGTIATDKELKCWLETELRYGAVRLETAAMVRAYRAATDISSLHYWNAWLSASKETEELREQSWQMGSALRRLLGTIAPSGSRILEDLGDNCNYAIAFAIAAANWQIPLDVAAIGYLQSWLSNLVGAGVKLIPLGQTQGQQILVQLYPMLDVMATEILSLDDDDLDSCAWGLSLASIHRETLYSRLFRS